MAIAKRESAESVEGRPLPLSLETEMAKTHTGNTQQINDLLYQALETEMGGIKLYEAAISCAVNDDLKEEWQGYLDETTTHRQVLLTVFEQLGRDHKAKVTGRENVANQGRWLVKTNEKSGREN